MRVKRNWIYSLSKTRRPNQTLLETSVTWRRSTGFKAISNAQVLTDGYTFGPRNTDFLMSGYETSNIECSGFRQCNVPITFPSMITTRGAESIIWLTHVSQKDKKVVGKAHLTRKKICKLVSAKCTHWKLCHGLAWHHEERVWKQWKQCMTATQRCRGIRPNNWFDCGNTPWWSFFRRVT